jgi:homoserine kinase
MVPKKGIRIINKDDYDLPLDSKKNVLGVALMALLEEVPEAVGFEIESTKIIKPGSGIGSSAASAAGVIAGANYLLDNRFCKEELIRFAMCGEALASGAKHADNVAPCIYGGITLIRCNQPVDVIQIPAPKLFVTIIHPQIEIKTSDARSILKQKILLSDAIKQWANVAGLITGLMKNDYELISRSMVDVIIEPIRSILIPGFDEVKKKSMEAGALGGGISGSGPSIFMLSKDEATAKAVERSAVEIYDKIGLSLNTYITTINNEGIKIIEN